MFGSGASIDIWGGGQEGTALGKSRYLWRSLSFKNPSASEAAPALRGFPKPVALDASLLGKHVAIWVWQEQVGLSVCALQPSHVPQPFTTDLQVW